MFFFSGKNQAVVAVAGIKANIRTNTGSNTKKKYLKTYTFYIYNCNKTVPIHYLISVKYREKEKTLIFTL